jgi:hypothetical protein
MFLTGLLRSRGYHQIFLTDEHKVITTLGLTGSQDIVDSSNRLHDV